MHFHNINFLFSNHPSKVSLLEGKIVLFKRSGIKSWQCRFRLDNGSLFSCTTASDQVAEASTRAIEIFHKIQQKYASGEVLRTRTFTFLAQEELLALRTKLLKAKNRQSIRDHIYVMEHYLVPFFGNKVVATIDQAQIDQFDSWRISQMGREPMADTQRHHATTFNKIMIRAYTKGLLNHHAKPLRLNIGGAKTQARPGFNIEEIERLLAFMPLWERRLKVGRTQRFHDMAKLCRCYVEFLLYTGIRQGTESMPVRWKDIQWHRSGSEQYLKIWVSGKTGPRQLIARASLIETLERLMTWQELPYESLDELIKSSVDRRVFTFPAGDQPYSMQGVFRRLIEDAALLRDPQTNQIRTLYSLRHTYATQALATGVDIHTVARQMGTSVVMLEKHYSKLTPLICAERLA